MHVKQPDMVELTRSKTCTFVNSQNQFKEIWDIKSHLNLRIDFGCDE